MSGILGRWRDRRRLVSISLSPGVAVCLACPVLGVEVLPELLRGAICFACGTRGGCSHKQVLKPENVGHWSHWRLGSQVVPDSCPTAPEWSHCSAHTCIHWCVCNNHTPLGQRPPDDCLLQILFPTSTAPNAVGSDGPPGLPCLYCPIYFPLPRAINPSVDESEFLGYHWSTCRMSSGIWTPVGDTFLVPGRGWAAKKNWAGFLLDQGQPLTIWAPWNIISPQSSPIATCNLLLSRSLFK